MLEEINIRRRNKAWPSCVRDTVPGWVDGVLCDWCVPGTVRGRGDDT